MIVLSFKSVENLREANTMQKEGAMIDVDMIAFNAREISQIIENTEFFQASDESRYTKEQSKVNAYEEIVELIKGCEYERFKD